jgi:hypothetical protein
MFYSQTEIPGRIFVADHQMKDDGIKELEENPTWHDPGSNRRPHPPEMSVIPVVRRGRPAQLLLTYT